MKPHQKANSFLRDFRNSPKGMFILGSRSGEPYQCRDIFRCMAYSSPTILYGETFSRRHDKPENILKTHRQIDLLFIKLGLPLEDRMETVSDDYFAVSYANPKGKYMGLLEFWTYIHKYSLVTLRNLRDLHNSTLSQNEVLTGLASFPRMSGPTLHFPKNNDWDAIFKHINMENGICDASYSFGLR